MSELTFASREEKSRKMDRLRESIKLDRDKLAVIGRRIERKIEKLQEFHDAPIV